MLKKNTRIMQFFIKIDQNAQAWEKFAISGGGGKPGGPNYQLLQYFSFEGSPKNL